MSLSILRRALWHINRTPLVSMVKFFSGVKNFSEVKARKTFAKKRKISFECMSCANELQEKGYTLINHIIDPHILSQAFNVSQQKLQQAEALRDQQHERHKSFLIRLLDADYCSGLMRSDNIFVQYALQDKVVDIITATLGSLPILMDVSLLLSSPTDNELSYSQLWHRDYDHPRTIKMFTYFSDVNDEGDGPFTFFDGQVSDTYRSFRKSHMPDEFLFKRLNSSERKVCYGPCFTTFLVETSRCLHMGSRLKKGHQRLLYTANFTAAPPVYPRKQTFQLSTEATIEDKLILNIPNANEFSVFI